MKKKILALFLTLILSGCFSTPPIKVDNICTLLDEEVSWYQAIRASEKKYSAPAAVQLAIIYQESRFASDAKPPRKKLFGVIPWFRQTSAYGFAQAVDDTWEWYKRDTSNHNAERDDFEDTADFTGWYIQQTNQRSGVKKSDAYNQYLAYHEGHGGFNKKSYQDKPWLIKIAKVVEKNAIRYKQQLDQCGSQLDRNNIWRFF